MRSTSTADPAPGRSFVLKEVIEQSLTDADQEECCKPSILVSFQEYGGDSVLTWYCRTKSFQGIVYIPVLRPIHEGLAERSESRESA